MDNLPRRTFTPIGDPGEFDPEVFTDLRETPPAQVVKIVIRDVVEARRHPWSGCARWAGSSRLR